jgi:uncharacterized secreted repeat protein (TIGR03808 family)
MTVGRRELMLAGLGVGLAAAAGPRIADAREDSTPKTGAPEAFSTYGVVPADGKIDQTATLQEAADKAARSGTPLYLPPGTYATGRLTLKSGTHIHGVPGLTILRFASGGAILATEGTDNVRLTGLVLDGAGKALGTDGALVIATDSTHFDVSDCRFMGSSEDGVVLRKVSGRVADCEISGIRKGALFSEDAKGLEITHNHVHDCGDNGILVWRSEAGEDGTIVNSNRIERIAAKSGGSGQNGNGINVFRAGAVLVNANRITDCAFSAIRSNSGSNCQMVANSCARLGQVALYAEFSFEGVVIANNIVDQAAMGVSVTNFKQGGRLAVVQGNIIRNLFLRKNADSRGIGIGVEADTVVSDNVIEGAPAYGILVGWGNYLRDVSVSDNVIRKAHIGIGVAVSASAGTALITDNLISEAKDGAIRAMKGPTPVGPDLAKASPEAYPNLAVYANVAR